MELRNLEALADEARAATERVNRLEVELAEARRQKHRAEGRLGIARARAIVEGSPPSEGGQL